MYQACINFSKRLDSIENVSAKATGGWARYVHLSHNNLVAFPLHVSLMEEGALVPEKVHQGKRDIRVGAGEIGFCVFRLALSVLGLKNISPPHFYTP